ncbi:MULTISPECIES: EexN family lipoprotein [Enterobacterales]|uniref:EexN family lipoprotein n=6 Tax=Enterobacterales TaxID=91347 RepID=A0A223LLX1_MORMO|nr:MULTISPECIES: EexN family lipoprotein [Enterobacterales]HCR3999087.1 EexN family lipoprotein [Citrobacter freundii]HDL8516972.1 EexN family lipoprotein [Yersinia enterocolitica]AMP35201.1 Exe [Enterobacter cloacae]ASF89461.1 putative entry exclusion protein [Klebsiella pneumoniae]ASU04938.1 Hypothetical protein [Klebsiella aerogenes]
MKKIVLVFLMMIGGLVLSGCKEDTKSVDWWYKNQDQAILKVKECNKSGDDTPNCKNAIQGKFLYDQEHAPIPKFSGMGDETDKYEKIYAENPDLAFSDYKSCKETKSISEKCDAALYAAVEYSDAKKHPELSAKFKEILK